MGRLCSDQVKCLPNHWSICPRERRKHGYGVVMVTRAIDDLDARLLAALDESPRAGVLDLARRLEVARGTVQARLEKLQRRGVVTGFGPQLDLPAMGYEVLAFTTLEIAQGRLADVV